MTVVRIVAPVVDKPVEVVPEKHCHQCDDAEAHRRSRREMRYGIPGLRRRVDS